MDTVNNDLERMEAAKSGYPDVVTFLEDRYREHLAEVIANRQAAGQPAANLDVALKRTSLAAFVRFARQYLNEHRVVENFFVDQNHGVRLDNGLAFVVSPMVDLGGTMQDSGAVGITQGRSQLGNEGVTPTDSRRII